MEQANENELCLGAGSETVFPLKEIKNKFVGSPDELIALLQFVQEKIGYLSEESLLEIARFTGVPAATVYGTATFYAQFRFRPGGKYLIRVCRGTACHVRGGSRILGEVEKQLGINPGESTADLKFALETVACIGACSQAPTMVVGNDAYGKMTKQKVKDILQWKE
jgi:NADH-quinone oxidoreductase subunit E